MLNLFRYLIKSTSYETLNQVQGDKMELFQRSLIFFLTKSVQHIILKISQI